MRNKKGLFILIAGILFFSGCASQVIQSSKNPHTLSTSLTKPGAGYFLPKGYIRVQLKPNNENKKELTINTIYEPDPDHFYALDYVPSVKSDDKVTVTLNNKSLLEKIEVESDEKSDEIIIKLIEIAKEAVKLAGTFPAAPLVGAEKIEYFDIILDPEDLLNSNETAEMKVLSDLGIKLKLVAIKVRGGEAGQPKKSATAAIKGRGNYQKGIYYRPLLPHRLTIENTINKSFTTETIYLPNRAPILVFDITRASFVKKVTNLTFTDGVLTEFEINKPSQFLAGIEIPLNLVKALVALPAEIIQLKFNISSENEKLLKQQKAEIEAKQALIEYLNQQAEENQQQQNDGNGGNGNAPDE